ncbi:MAG: PEP/pyruvate-binding domain-containing protein [Pseudomonadota bacterium]
MSERWLYTFEELGKEHNDMVGKKCAYLGEMAKIGLPVPQGFALSLDAYRKFMGITGATEEVAACIECGNDSLECIAGVNELSRAIRRTVESKPMPREMEETIGSHYEHMSARCGVAELPVSARSAGALSRPGQYETHLNVKGKADLIEKIKKVWSSTYNPTSLSFRHKGGLRLESDPIGVAVLRMVNARVAGIVFTADPNTGDTSRMMIEANWGLGESVVGGESMPDTYIVEKKTFKVLEKRLGTKSRIVVPSEKGTVEKQTPEEMACRFCLSDEEVAEIAKTGVRLEKHFGLPQDVEWAIDGDLSFPDAVVLLQTRAEVLAKKKEPVDQLLDMMMSRFIRL